MKSLRSVPKENIFPAPFDVSWFYQPTIRKLLSILQSEGAEVFAVGGCVRDSFWKKKVEEIDLAINIDPIQVKELLNKIDCRVLNIGIEYGTVTVILEGYKFEITSFRKDIKTFGRKAKVQYCDDLKEDAKRRDFSFNTIYLKPNGLIVDPLGHFSDLRSGTVKFVGDPNERINEDHLRILRYFRFVSRFPNTNKAPDQETLSTIKRKRHLILELSRERIWNELKLILCSHSIDLVISLMNQTGLLALIFPQARLDLVQKMSKLEKMLEKIINKVNEGGSVDLCDPIRRLALLSNGSDDFHQTMFSLDKKELKRLRFYQLQVSKIFESCHLMGFRHGLQNGIDLLLLSMTVIEEPASSKIEEETQIILKRCHKKIVEGSFARFPLSGQDLLNKGYSGRNLGLILKELETAWIASGFSLSRCQLLKKV